MSSSTSASTPVSGHSTSETLTLADEIKKYNTSALIEFLSKEEDLGLEKKHFDILREQEINGRTFLKITKEEFEQHGLKLGPATALADFAKEIKEKKLRAFSSYRSLKEVLEKYGLDSEGIDSIPLFEPQTHKIKDEDKTFNRCMEEILGRLRSYGTLQPDSLEAMRNEYVVAILHAALHIVMDKTGKELSMRPQYEIVGEESKGRVDYAIKEAEDLICITEDKQHKVPMGFAQNIKQLESSYETNKKKRKADQAFGEDFDYLYGIVTTGRDWHFLLYSPGVISKASDTAFTIEFTKKALEEGSEEYKALSKAVKKVLEVVTGLLKDRASADASPDSKRVRIEGYRLKK